MAINTILITFYGLKHIAEKHFVISIHMIFLVKKKYPLSFNWKLTFMDNHQNFKDRIYIPTVESALFMEDQCLWYSWVTLTHEFTPPQRFKGREPP